MRVLLLNPPRRDGVVMVKEGRCMQRKGAWGYVMAPVTLVTMATLLRGEGHEVAVMDCPAAGTGFPEMQEAARALRPEVVFVNTSTPTIDDDVLAAARMKALGAVTVMIGIHPTARPGDALGPGKGVDACIGGEPELAARDVVAALARGESLRSVPGVASVDGEGALVPAAERPPIANLDDLPIPDWSLVDRSRYRLPLNGNPFLLVNTSRGCPHRCTFCNAHVYYGRVPRRRSVDHVLREIRQDVEVFGVRDLMFWSEEFLQDEPFVHALCEGIVRSGLEVRWVCNGRVDAVSEGVVSSLRRAGCWNLALGIESGNPEALSRSRKQILPGQTRRAVEMARRGGLAVTGHVILGLPGDTRETIEATGRFVEELGLDFVQYYCAVPYPGTDLHAEAVANGWIDAAGWEAFEHNRSVLSYPHLPSGEVERLRRRLMLRWYLAPRRIARTLRRHVAKPSDAWWLLRSASGFLRWV